MQPSRMEFGKRPQNAALILTMIGAVILESIGWFSSDPKLEMAGIVIVLVPLAFWLLETKYQETQRPDIETEIPIPNGFRGFFKDRKALENPNHDLGMYISSAKEEIFIVALSSLHLISNNQDVIKERVGKGCRFKFLLPDSLLNARIVDHFEDSEFPSTYKISISRIKQIIRYSEYAGKIEARVYSGALPTLGLVFVDANKPSGKACVELYPYHFGPMDRPSFMLHRTGEPDLVRALYLHYAELWKNSTPVLDAGES